MFNVCPRCGQYADDKTIDPAGPYAICPHCGHAHPFLRLPLFVLTGASGTGKTTVCLELPRALPECVCLEADILWRPEFDTPHDGYYTHRNLWLRLCKNIGQGGRPVFLCGSSIPKQYEACAERRYFSAIHHLALVRDDDELLLRLQARPAWRRCQNPEFIEAMLAFNRWFTDHANDTKSPMTLLDTTHTSVENVIARVARWVRARLPDRA